MINLTAVLAALHQCCFRLKSSASLCRNCCAMALLEPRRARARLPAAQEESQVDGQPIGVALRWVEWRLGRQSDGYSDEWMNQRLDGGMDRPTDGWMHFLVCG